MLSLDTAPATLKTGEPLRAYSGWKLMDNYDTCASVFVVLFNGFMSLTSYFYVMYRCYNQQHLRKWQEFIFFSSIIL